jgi:hypothetical protein
MKFELLAPVAPLPANTPKIIELFIEPPIPAPELFKPVDIKLSVDTILIGQF